MKGEIMLGVRLDHETELRLEHLCEETGHSKSYFVKKAIREFLDDREDYLLGIAALERNESTISLKQLEKDIGLDD
jgi:RHH-type transcriptional regulator, rel operon repressor / antitoxin RelB